MPSGRLPPDMCIEIALWDRFGWGPEDTNKLTFKQMKELFVIIEQQRVTRDAVENLGAPSSARFEQRLAERKAQQDADKEIQTT